MRWTIVGDCIAYNGKLATPTANLSIVKIHLNHTISTKGGHYDVIDIKDFYLGTPMIEYEYARIPLSKISQEIINQCHLTSISHEGYMMIEVRRGVYGLPQAGTLANQQLVVHLKPYRCYEMSTRGLFQHLTQYTSFTLVVNDFDVCTTSRVGLDHLHNALNSKYTTSIDRTSALYLGIALG